MKCRQHLVQYKQSKMKCKKKHDKILNNQVTILNSIQELIGTLNHSNSKTQSTKEKEYMHNLPSLLVSI